MLGLSILEILLSTAVIVILGTVIVRVFGQAAGGVLQGTGRPDRDLAALEERTARLEESLTEMNEKLGRLAEGQEFTTKVLLERK